MKLRKILSFYFIIPFSLFSNSCEKDAQEYKNFLESSEVRSYKTTLYTLNNSLCSHLHFILESNSQLNLISEKALGILGTNKVSYAVLRDPQKIYDLLKQLEYSICMVHEIRNALMFNLAGFLEKISSFAHRPFLNQQVKKTVDEYSKRFQEWKFNLSFEQKSYSEALFQLEGAISTRLIALRR